MAFEDAYRNQVTILVKDEFCVLHDVSAYASSDAILCIIYVIPPFYFLKQTRYFHPSTSSNITNIFLDCRRKQVLALIYDAVSKDQKRNTILID